MTVVDKQKVRKIVQMQYAARVQQQYGADGAKRLPELALALDRIYEHLAFELVRQGLTVLIALEDGKRLLPADRSVEVAPGELPTIVRGQATIQVLSADRMLVMAEASDPRAYANDAVVYYFSDADYFVISGEPEAVLNITNFPSIFGTPTFFELDDALQHYKLHMALHSQCSTLVTCWHDAQQWLLINKPEDTMQRSLHRFLRDTVRSHQHVEWRREQPVEGKRPPDIKITWSQSNRIAYLEVKWMGASVSDDKTKVSTEYDERDARDGAKQLAEYLDANKTEGATHQTLGYLVVYDARRKDIAFATTDLPTEDALYFQTRDVPYDPDYHAARHDFARPLRFFMMPA